MPAIKGAGWRRGRHTGEAREMASKGLTLTWGRERVGVDMKQVSADWGRGWG